MIRRPPFVIVLALIPVLVHGAELDGAQEIVFKSGDFTLVGDLNLPEGKGPFPVVIFVHGDGPNNRTSGVTYPPIMKRMHRAGFGTFAWDKPGTGESTGEFARGRVQRERTQIVLDAIDTLKMRPDIDKRGIGLWGISQAGYVMPRVLSASGDVSFMIAVSCPGESGVEQGAYLVAAQAVCLGLPEDDREEVESLLSSASRAQSYDLYARHKARLADFPAVMALADYGVNVGVRPEADWSADDPEGEYFWDPMESIEQARIPVLAVFGGNDTQADPVQGSRAYERALRQAGQPLSRVVLVPGGDHNILRCETGSLLERSQRSPSGWTDYVPTYLDTLETWLRELARSSSTFRK